MPLRKHCKRNRNAKRGRPTASSLRLVQLNKNDLGPIVYPDGEETVPQPPADDHDVFSTAIHAAVIGRKYPLAGGDDAAETGQAHLSAVGVSGQGQVGTVGSVGGEELGSVGEK